VTALKKTSTSRLAFLDWTRGLAAIVMLNGHVFHSFTRPDLRGSSPFMLTQFIGGMPPAAFLFLLGVTLAFLMEGREKQGLPAASRVWAALLRSRYLFVIAFLFRLQLWVFGLPKSPWTDLFRVDILNAMGFAVLALSGLAVFRTVDRARLGAVLGLLIAFASPIVSSMSWSWLPGLLRTYLVPDSLAFGFFPWGAFVAFGVSAGSIIRLVGKEHLDRIMQGAALLGMALIVAARYCAALPYSLYTNSEYWLNGPWLILIKLGVILLILPAAYLWTQYGAGPGWSWVRQFGTTSLLVYWVHTELVYGRWFYFWKEGLTPLQVVFVSLTVILLMLLLSVVKTNWARFRQPRLAFLWPSYIPPRIPGD
jgi:uncharacterized membrane protein